ncbi:PKD domain-containing protein, partial [Patescibacteria group bacterium]|nr:PKD domain-containing protein [Patescibacteria group bacterium]
FDASTTLDKERIQSVRWNFGDNSEEVMGAGASLNLSQIHTYEEQGTYPLILEVTDIQNNVDRVVLNVVVSTPIARMDVSPGTQLFVNEPFTLDASTSISDGAQITDYTWTPGNEKALKLTGPKNIETLKGAFTEPGTNKIELKVTDSIGGEDTDTINIRVESKAPEAQFKYGAPDKDQPAVYEFDGTLSFDPDGQGPLTYKWAVNGQTTGAAFEFVNGTTNASEKPKIKFKDKGKYTVTLTAIDPNGFGTGKAQEGKAFSNDITVNDTLDIAWKAGDKTSATLAVNKETEVAQAEMKLNLISEHAIAFDINWGDDETESGEMNQSKSLSHIYAEAGTYTVKATVYDQENLEKTISRKVFIGSADTPVAIAGISINGNEISDTTGTITIGRNDTVSFDAGKSLNTDGTSLRLKYSWDFGNGQKSTQAKSNQQYKEIGTYNVSLKVTNAADVSQVSGTDKITLEVVGEPPVLRSITAVPTGNTLITPVTVQLNAVGASDPDGRITRYRWWYYDPKNDSDQLGLQVTSSPTATLIIGTRGLEGEKKTYKFAVELTDDENNSISSRDLLDESRTATLEVTNGPNKAPTATFNVDKTSIFAGDAVNFSSGSSDPDGQITAYYWDFEGDGFANNTDNLGSNVSHVFNKAAPDGIKVRLKVKDNNESEALSDPITIYVDAVAKDPVSAFTSEQQPDSKKVQFTDTSQPDIEAEVTIKSWDWDFDVNKDSNGDGLKDNDTDSTEQNPVYEYPDYGIYRAKLTVTDSERSKASVTNFVNVKAPAAQPVKKVEARLLTNPAPSLADGKVHLKGENEKVVLDFSTSVGEITRYTIDKNIYFDTDGNGKKDDDIDYAATKPGKWTTEFFKDYGQIKVRLTVEDKDGNKDTVDKEIIFDVSAPVAPAVPSGTTEEGTDKSLMLTTNVFGDQASMLPGVLVSLAGFGILLKVRKHIRKNKKNE